MAKKKKKYEPITEEQRRKRKQEQLRRNRESRQLYERFQMRYQELRAKYSLDDSDNGTPSAPAATVVALEPGHRTRRQEMPADPAQSALQLQAERTKRVQAQGGL